jgi:hypothetical protein
MDQESKIINLVPAAGWKAIYEKHGRRTTVPLVAWALVELEQDSSSRAITGLVLRNGVPTPANRQSDFKGYERAPEGAPAREHGERSTKPSVRASGEPAVHPSEEEGASLWFA